MSYSNPAAPPPSYNDLFTDEQSQNTDPTTVNHNGRHHTHEPLDLNTLHLPENTSLQPQPPIQTQPEREVIVIQGGPLILGPHPVRLLCPNCNKSTLTRIEYRNSCATHAIATMLCLIGCFCLAPVPYCVDNCKNAAHYCRKCSKHIATDFSNGFFGFH